MKVLFVRHCQSLNNIKSQKLGKGNISLLRESDPAITPLGQKQAFALGAFLKKQNIPLSAIETSPYLRALQTAEHILKGYGNPELPTKVWKILFEKKGCYFWTQPRPGLSRSEIHKLYPGWEIEPSISEAGWNADREHVETYEETKARAKELVDALRARQKAKDYDPDKYLLLVSHGSFMSILFLTLFGMVSHDAQSYNSILFKNSSMTLVEFKQTGGTPIVHFINAQPHLEAADL